VLGLHPAVVGLRLLRLSQAAVLVLVVVLALPVLVLVLKLVLGPHQSSAAASTILRQPQSNVTVNTTSQ
jgi:hypothetical protein